MAEQVFEQNKIKKIQRRRHVQCAETAVLFYSMTRMQRFESKVKNKLA
jgi:hypothetical protein